MRKITMKEERESILKIDESKQLWIKNNADDYKCKYHEPLKEENKQDIITELVDQYDTDPLCLDYKLGINNKPFLDIKKDISFSNISNNLLPFCKREKFSPEKNLEYSDVDSFQVEAQAKNSSIEIKNHKKKGSKRKTVRGENVFFCSLCDYRSNNRRNFREHWDVHLRNKPFKCEHCDYGTARKSTLVKHLRAHGIYGTELDYICSHCDSRFVYRYNLLRHLKRVHSENTCSGYLEKPRPFKCPQCTITYGTNYELQRHLLSHSREFPYQCAHCHFGTKRRYILEQHLFRHNNIKLNKNLSINKQIFCKICFKFYNSSLKTHLQAECKNIGHNQKKQTYNDQIKKGDKLHMKEFKDKYPFECATCNFRTSKRSLLKYHIVGKHTKEPTFQCSSCSYSTFRRSDLLQHKRSKKHDVYCCAHCDYVCFKYLDVQKHMQNHFTTH